MRLYMGYNKVSLPSSQSSQSARLTVPSVLIKSLGIKNKSGFWIIYDTDRDVVELHRKRPGEAP